MARRRRETGVSANWRGGFPKLAPGAWADAIRPPSGPASRAEGNCILGPSPRAHERERAGVSALMRSSLCVTEEAFAASQQLQRLSPPRSGDLEAPVERVFGEGYGLLELACHVSMRLLLPPVDLGLELLCTRDPVCRGLREIWDERKHVVNGLLQVLRVHCWFFRFGGVEARGNPAHHERLCIAA